MWDASRWYGRHSYGYGSSGDGIAGGILLVGVLVVVLLALAFWAAVQAVDLVIRAWRQCHGKSQALKLALLTWLGLVGLLLVCGLGIETRFIATSEGSGIAAGLGGLLVVSTIALLITARATEVKYRQTFANESETLVTKVLRRPWWTSAREQVA